jgi:membrane dipeptidase
MSPGLPPARREFLKALAAAPLTVSVAGMSQSAFAGTAAVAPPAGSAADLHGSAIVIDHAVPLLQQPDDAYIAKTRAGGTTVAMATVASNNDFRSAIDAITRWLDRFGRDPTLIQVMTVEDIYRAKREGKLGVGFHFQNSRPVEHDLRLLEVFHRLGVRVIQLTYNEKNPVGDGSTERTDSGLSKFGLKMVEEMNRLGIVVDVSHVGHRTSMDAIEASKAPVIFSHSNAWAVFASKRNLKDDQIKAVAKTGGVIGMNGFPGFISKDSFVDKDRGPSLDQLLDHVDYIAKLVGTDHIGLGLDYSQSTPEGYKRWGYEADTYPMPPWHYPTGIDDISMLPNFTKGLKRRGYSDEDVRKILGENFIRVFKAVWKA